MPLDIQQFANNASTTLAANINSTQTTLTVASSTPFPTLTTGNWFMATIQEIVDEVVTAWEIVQVIAVSGTTWTIVRGQEGTTASSWSSGNTIALLPTAGGQALMAQQLNGSFTGTLNGVSGSPTETFIYRIVGDIATVLLNVTLSGLGTSNSLSVTGLPAALGSNLIYLPCPLIADDELSPGAVSISGETMTLYLLSGGIYSDTAFETGVVNGLRSGFCVTFPIQ